MISTSAFGAIPGYDIKVDYTLNGKPVTGTHLRVKEGETATMITKKGSQESFMEVTPVKSDKGVHMKFVLGTIDENGERSVISTPEVITGSNGKAQIIQDDKDGDKMSLSVLAKEQSI